MRLYKCLHIFTYLFSAFIFIVILPLFKFYSQFRISLVNYYLGEICRSTIRNSCIILPSHIMEVSFSVAHITSIFFQKKKNRYYLITCNYSKKTVEITNFQKLIQV